MTEDNNSREFTESELRNAGASGLFIGYYKAAPAGASARREVENGPFDLETLNESPHLGGGFFEALWSGDTELALRRADSQNTAILEDSLGIRKV